MAAELFTSMSGTKVQHVPYKGSSAAHPDLLAGRTVMIFDPITAIAPHVKAGSLRGIAVTTTQRSKMFPDIPTVADSLPGYEAATWGGILAPAGTPKEIVAKLNADIVKALNDPEVKKRLLENGAEAMPGTPDQFAKTLRSEITKWGKVVKAANIKAD